MLGSKNPLPYYENGGNLSIFVPLGFSQVATDERTDDTSTICGLHGVVDHLVGRTSC